MIERIKLLMQHYGLSVNAFAAKIGSNQVTINQQMNGDRKVSLDTVLKIINSFELISVEWLLTGKGDMFKSSANTESSITIGNISDRLLSIIESQQRTIENLSKK